MLTVAGMAQAVSAQTPAATYKPSPATAPKAAATSKNAAPKSALTKTTPAKTTAAKGAPVKSTAPKSSPVRSAATRTAVSKTAASKAVSKVNTKAVSSKTANGKSKKVPAPRGPIAQQQPTVDRYREIQQALADKGYFSGMPDGNWGAESAEALKRFQREQNLEADGKIGALSLMALGLGPRRGTASAQAAGPPDGAIPVDPPPVAQPAP